MHNSVPFSQFPQSHASQLTSMPYKTVSMYEGTPLARKREALGDVLMSWDMLKKENN